MRSKLIFVLILTAMIGLAEARERGGGWNRRGGMGGMLGGLFGGNRESPAAAMEIHEGKVFLINGGSLYVIDAAQMQIEGTASLTELARSEMEKEKKADDAETVPLPHYIQNYDKNNDGKIEKDEVENPDRTWRMLGRMDRDGDNVITGKEANSSMDRFSKQIMGSRKPAVIKIAGDKVLVLANNRMFKFNRADLKFESSVPVPDQDISRARTDRRKRDAEAAKEKVKRDKEEAEKKAVAPPKPPAGEGF